MKSLPEGSTRQVDKQKTGVFTPDFKTIFESIPGRYLVLNPALEIVAVSDAYLIASLSERDEILGRSIFEVFRDSAEDPFATGLQNLSASLQRVLAQKVPDTMAVQKHTVRCSEAEGGGFQERFLTSVNSPVLANDTSVQYIFHLLEDVTDFMRVSAIAADRDAVLASVKNVIVTRRKEIDFEICTGSAGNGVWVRFAA